MKTEIEYQKGFYLLVSELVTNAGTGLSNFEESLAMMSTLAQDDKLNDLIMVLRLHFPEYYTDYKPFRV